ncbi:NAD(P)-dependent oxidoreductase [Amycolatopsis rubida]|uniref:NAD(P)-dependent oxidoreductase n=1 Tax=Amycolatopsis rubida TaxID=112413 RepID=A0ABX0C4B2_9PSEU|nr:MULTISPECIES: NAD(P)-dependent oxidoreductase [Amycolatopsis]MYW96107.1 NAD-binding protein [Amycolatopsis rubida]NEC61098.1 NAD(P)-dependent oxidoreductase [Amycolatopsis rubida]OAP23382.1 3-hydroxyisobutyrate dehydrogenase [Amycolatopsis sp. M39]
MAQSAAVIGLGAMGAPIARRIQEAGHELTVCDKRQEAVRPLTESGAKVAEEPAGCGHADIVLVVVATGDQVRETLLGAGGLVSGLGTHKPLVVVMSTVGQVMLVALRDQLNEKGLRLIDAPISGGAVRAAEGTLSVLVGGDEADFEAVKPVLDLLGRNIFHCGPVGSAQLVKIANNVLGNVNTLASAEVYRLLLEHGLAPSEVAPIFEASSGRNWLTADAGEVARAYAHLAGARREFDAVTPIMRKDIGLGTALARESSGSYPLIQALANVISHLGDETYENWHIVGTSRGND